MPSDPTAPRYNWLVTCRDGTRLTYYDFQTADDVRVSHDVNYAVGRCARADTIVRKDIPDMLSAEELETYQPGHNCTCQLWDAERDRNPTRCACYANRTPHEVYMLRNLVCDLESKNDLLKHAIGVTKDVITELRDMNRQNADEYAELRKNYAAMATPSTPRAIVSEFNKRVRSSVSTTDYALDA
jgi:hypothetical protein